MSRRQKLTDEQKDAIFLEYLRTIDPKKRRAFEREKSMEYGVHQTTINGILRDEERIARFEKRITTRRRLAQLQMDELITDALAVQAGYIHDDTLPANLQYLRQNASVDIMNRAGFKRKEEETEQRMIISFDGMPGVTLGSPEQETEDGEVDV